MKELYFADHGRNVAGLDFASKGCHFCTRRRQQHFTVGEEPEMRQSSTIRRNILIKNYILSTS